MVKFIKLKDLHQLHLKTNDCLSKLQCYQMCYENDKRLYPPLNQITHNTT